jgi:hypothetical protein
VCHQQQQSRTAYLEELCLFLLFNQDDEGDPEGEGVEPGSELESLVGEEVGANGVVTNVDAIVNDEEARVGVTSGEGTELCSSPPCIVSTMSSG